MAAQEPPGPLVPCHFKRAGLNPNLDLLIWQVFPPPNQWRDTEYQHDMKHLGVLPLLSGYFLVAGGREQGEEKRRITATVRIL